MTIYRRIILGIYLSFAIAGAVLPTLANINYMNEYGPSFDVYSFIELANVNPAAQSLSRDLLVGAGSILFWIVLESRRLKMRNLWVVILATILVAFAFSAPLFLFLRELRLNELEKQGEEHAVSKIDI